MAKKSSTVRKAFKSKVGKQMPKAVSRPARAKQPKVQLDAKKKSAHLNAYSNTAQPDIKRPLKIQKALYEIADAASAVRDMHSFYKKLHKIVGKMMYA
jgi:hypothetical protein